MNLHFACVADVRCRIGESPLYDERTGRLYFVDTLGRLVYCREPESGELKSWTFESEVGSLGLAASGRLVVALRDGVILFDPASGAKQELCRIEADIPETRLNDGRVGPDGAFWIGSMDDRADKEPIGALYRVDPSGRVERKVDRLFVSNGLAWTADGELMFHADSRGPWIDRWRFDRNTGEISERARIAEPEVALGRPDGGSCDADGYYWSAGVSAGHLNRFSPNGRLVESYETPVPAPTMPCFGGPGYRTLYLTSLREGRSAALMQRSPLSGAVFAAESPVAGFPSWRFLDI
ncbi:MAG: SMP-30/gluconolactonase/LRE family protein [Propylenella sp.]